MNKVEIQKLIAEAVQRTKDTMAGKPAAKPAKKKAAKVAVAKKEPPAKKAVVHNIKKKAVKSEAPKTSDASHLNLRCPKCDYYAKTTGAMLKQGRLRCPIDKSILQTKDERGETRGRHAA